MNDFISREAAIKALSHGDGCGHVCRHSIERIPAADVVEVVRCKDCKHRIVNEHYGEKGYMKLKAMCELDSGDPFELGRYAEEDDWFCADGERKEGGPDS